jgi:hypothetical protein
MKFKELYEKFIEKTYDLPFNEWKKQREELAKLIQIKKDKNEKITLSEMEEISKKYNSKILFDLFRYIGEKCDLCGSYFNVSHIRFEIGQITQEGHYCCSEPGARWIPRVILLEADWSVRGYESIKYHFIVEKDWLRNFKKELMKKIRCGKSLPSEREWRIVKEILKGEIALKTRGNLCESCYKSEYEPPPKALLSKIPDSYLKIVPEGSLKNVIVKK